MAFVSWILGRENCPPKKSRGALFLLIPPDRSEGPQIIEKKVGERIEQKTVRVRKTASKSMSPLASLQSRMQRAKLSVSQNCDITERKLSEEALRESADAAVGDG